MTTAIAEQIRVLETLLANLKAEAELEADAVPALKYKVGDKVLMVAEVLSVDKTAAPLNLSLPDNRIYAAYESEILGLASDFAPIAKPDSEPMKVGDRVLPKGGVVKRVDTDDLPIEVLFDGGSSCCWFRHEQLVRI